MCTPDAQFIYKKTTTYSCIKKRLKDHITHDVEDHKGTQFLSIDLTL